MKLDFWTTESGLTVWEAAMDLEKVRGTKRMNPRRKSMMAWLFRRWMK